MHGEHGIQDGAVAAAVLPEIVEIQASECDPNVAALVTNDPLRDQMLVAPPGIAGEGQTKHHGSDSVAKHGRRGFPCDAVGPVLPRWWTGMSSEKSFDETDPWTEAANDRANTVQAALRSVQV